MQQRIIHGVALSGWKAGGAVHVAAAHEDPSKLRLVAAALEAEGFSARVDEAEGQGFYCLSAERENMPSAKR
jgi:hypothetical protein